MSVGDRRVAIVGVGAVTPAGPDLRSLWDTLLDGRSCAAPIQGFDCSRLPVRFACQIESVPMAGTLPPKEQRRLDRSVQLAASAATSALGQAGCVPYRSDRRAVVVGTGMGGLGTFESSAEVYRSRGTARVSPFTVPMVMPNAAAAYVSKLFRSHGPSLTVTSACASGAVALGEAARLVRAGDADVVLVGGTEALISELVFSAFTRTDAMSKRNDEPHRASRPFDVERDGFVMGEGAAFFVLEDWESASARGAAIIGEVLGYGHTSDAHHMVAPLLDGKLAARAMANAIESAGLTSGDIVHVNAHGTSTPLNDTVESLALRAVFRTGAPPVTSVKGSIGHLLGAAGSVEAAVALVSARTGIVPPVANHSSLDPSIDLDVVADEPRKLAPGPVLSNSFAFGGHNVALVLGPGDEDPLAP